MQSKCKQFTVFRDFDKFCSHVVGMPKCEVKGCCIGCKTENCNARCAYAGKLKTNMEVERMANKKKTVIDVESEAALEVVEMEKKQEELKVSEQAAKELAIAQVFEMSGKIKAVAFFESQTRLMKLLYLKQVKDAKTYREKFEMTWEQFCEHVGEDRRRVDEDLMDLKPFKADWLTKFVNGFGVEINKVKYLGEAISANSAKIQDNAIVYDGEVIPLSPEHRDDIQALLERLEESYTAQIEDKAANLKTKDRLIAAKEDVIKKQEKELHRLEKAVNKTLDLSDLSEEEQEAVELLAGVQGEFVKAISTIKQKISYQSAPEVALRQLYFLFIFISKVAMEERMSLHELYKDADEVPWEIVEEELPATDVLVDNLPLTKGMGKAYKGKIEARKGA